MKLSVILKLFDLPKKKTLREIQDSGLRAKQFLRRKYGITIHETPINKALYEIEKRSEVIAVRYHEVLEAEKKEKTPKTNKTAMKLR